MGVRGLELQVDEEAVGAWEEVDDVVDPGCTVLCVYRDLRAISKNTPAELCMRV